MPCGLVLRLQTFLCYYSASFSFQPASIQISSVNLTQIKSAQLVELVKSARLVELVKSAQLVELRLKSARLVELRLKSAWLIKSARLVEL